MGRYTVGTDRGRSQDRIAKAQEKHKNKLEHKRAQFPEKDILALPFDACKYGERIRYLRTTKDLTVSELAPEIGTTAATLSKMENGSIKNLNIEFLYLLCAVLNTSPHYLLGVTSNPDLVPYTDENGNVQYLSEPISFTEETPALLSNVLFKLVGVTDDAYQKDPDLCKALLYILEHRNPEIRHRLKDAIQGICAICLTPDEWAKLNSVDG